MNKRHKLLRRVFSTVMALVLAVSLLPTYAFAASVPASTTTDGNAADFTGAWKSAHYKPGTYTVTANLAMPGQYNPILTGVTIRKVPGKTDIDLDNTTIEVIKLDLEPYGYTLDMNYAIVVKTNGEVCQNWLAGENVMTLTVKLGDYQKLGWSGDWLCADGNYGNPVVLFENAKSDDVDSYRVSEDGTTASVDIIPENYPSSNASKHMNEQVKVISIGNLGLLYIVTTDPTIQSIQNLAGRTVYSIGEGGPPEYTFEYMLEQYHLIGQVRLGQQARLGQQVVLTVEIGELRRDLHEQVHHHAHDVRVAAVVKDALRRKKQHARRREGPDLHPAALRAEGHGLAEARAACSGRAR